MSVIDEYILHFEQAIKEVTSGSNRLHKKILLCAIIDALARARCKRIEKPKERFITFIRECADWPDGDRISLPQLLYRLEGSPTTNKLPLIEKVKLKVGIWKTGNVYRLDLDPLKDEELTLFPTSEDRLLMKDVKHVALLYEYRCSLVHEFREPGYGIEFSDDGDSPYYHAMNDLDGNMTWELVYPTDFFISLATNSLANLKQHLQDNDCNPYACYDFGTIWKKRSVKK